MSVDPTLLTALYDNVDRSTYTTASISPTANRWLVIDVVNRQGTATVPTPTITGLSGGSTLTWVTEIAWPYSNNLRRLSRFYAWTGSSPGSGTISIALGTTQTGCAWIVYEMGADVDTSDPFIVTLPTEVSDNNIAFNTTGYSSADNRPLVAVWHAANQTSAHEAGYTEIADVSGDAPVGGLASAFHPTVADTTPTYSWASNVNALGIWSEIKAAAVGAQTVSPGIIANSPVLFEPRIDQQVQLGLINNGYTIFAPTIAEEAPGDQTVSPGLIENAPVLFAPQIDQSVVIGLINNTPVVYAPTVNQTVEIGLINNAPTLYEPRIDQSVAIGLIENLVNLFPPTINQQVQVGLIANPSTVYAPTITDDGPQTVSVGRISHGTHVYSPTITQFWVRDVGTRPRRGGTRMPRRQRSRYDRGRDTGR